MSKSPEKQYTTLEVAIKPGEWLTQAIKRSLEENWIQNTTKLELLKLAASASSGAKDRRKEDIKVWKDKTYTVVNPVYSDERYKISIPKATPQPQQVDTTVMDWLARRSDITTGEGAKAFRISLQERLVSLTQQLNQVNAQLIKTEGELSGTLEEYWFTQQKNRWIHSTGIIAEIVTKGNWDKIAHISHKLGERTKLYLLGTMNWINNNIWYSESPLSTIQKVNQLCADYNAQRKTLRALESEEWAITKQISNLWTNVNID